MTDIEYSQSRDDSEEDIYKDIPEFNFEDELAKLEGSKETYKQEASDLSEKLKLLSEENKELKKLNEILKKNLSTLLKTAQAEIKRKDSMIQELRSQVESFTFRRNKNITKDKHTSTNDLEFSSKMKCEPEKHKSVSDTKRSKSYENWTSNEGERRSNQEEEKWKEALAGKEENANCDIDRNASYCRKDSKTNFRQDSSHDWHRGKKSSRYEDSSEYRRSYRKDHRVHLKCDSFDKKRHSRSSDCIFPSRRRYSRERRSDHRRRNNSERRRSDESLDRSRRRKESSRSRERSRGSKESSLEKVKIRSSRDKDSNLKIREQISKPEISDGGRGSEIADRKNTRVENSEKQNVHESAGGKNKQIKEKRSQEPNLDIFSAKSPLDALYSEMVSSRNSNRFCSTKSGTTQLESDIEEGELSVTQTKNEHLDTSESQSEEDWTMSFKNERTNDIRPMTLYSRRMMRKFSSEIKSTHNPKGKEELEKKEESENAGEKKTEKIEEVEKEPGELTDDENVIESSKEFQEVAKAASIKIELNEKTAKEKIFKEPSKRDPLMLENLKTEPNEIQKEIENPSSGGEDPNACREIETNKETREVIECSPFKNNYKLIEISPIKLPGSEHILDFYNQRNSVVQPLEPITLNSSDAVMELEKSKKTDTVEEKNAKSELKIVNPPITDARKENEKAGNNEGKELRKKKEKTEEKKFNDSKKERYLGRGKRRLVSRKEVEKSVTDEISLKRKRKSSEANEGDSESKKLKLEKNEPHRKRSKSTMKSKTECEESEPEREISELEMDEKVKEDISSFEFFKPTTKAEIPGEGDKSVCSTTDYKMTATMSLTGVVRLETPDKCMERLKNLMINEHMIFNVLDSKANSQFSPLIGSKCTEMTPRRLLKNDLMLTDSEDDSLCKQNTGRGEDEAEEERAAEEGADETSGSDNSECDSDSGASDFVDLL